MTESRRGFDAARSVLNGFARRVCAIPRKTSHFPTFSPMYVYVSGRVGFFFFVFFSFFFFFFRVSRLQ